MCDTSVWQAHAPSDTAPLSLFPAAGGAPHTGGRSAERLGRLPAESPPHEVSADS